MKTTTNDINAAARSLGARGGTARALALSPQQRQDIARTAGLARKPARHLCFRNGWQTCSACQGRIHLQGCTSKRLPTRDCCIRRHKQLHDQGQTVGLDDTALPMFDTARPTWA